MAWKAIPTIRVSVTGCMVVSPNTEIGSPPIIFPKDMINAEKGIINIPTMMDDKGERFFIIVVIKFTNRKTKKGFTLAIHPGEASAPTIRITYLGIEAYICCCTIQKPLVIRMRATRRPFLHTFIKACHISERLLPCPAVCVDLYMKKTITRAIKVIVPEK